MNTTLPITVTPETEALIDQLNMRKEFEQIIEHVPQIVPDLFRFRVYVPPNYDLGGDDVILIEAHRDLDAPFEDYPSDRPLTDWLVGTFSGEVLLRFCVLVMEVPPDAG